MGGTRPYSGVESTPLTLIQHRNKFVCPVEGAVSLAPTFFGAYLGQFSGIYKEFGPKKDGGGGA